MRKWKPTHRPKHLRKRPLGRLLLGLALLLLRSSIKAALDVLCSALAPPLNLAGYALVELLDPLLDKLKLEEEPERDRQR